jgi:hypothetical protein
MVRAVLILSATLALAACGPGENEPGPGDVTVGEAKALDEAAAMLDERRSPAADVAQVPAQQPPDATVAPAED